MNYNKDESAIVDKYMMMLSFNLLSCLNCFLVWYPMQQHRMKERMRSDWKMNLMKKGKQNLFYITGLDRSSCAVISLKISYNICTTSPNSKNSSSIIPAVLTVRNAIFMVLLRLLFFGKNSNGYIVLTKRITFEN